MSENSSEKNSNKYSKEEKEEGQITNELKGIGYPRRNLQPNRNSTMRYPRGYYPPSRYGVGYFPDRRARYGGPEMDMMYYGVQQQPVMGYPPMGYPGKEMGMQQGYLPMNYPHQPYPPMGYEMQPRPPYQRPLYPKQHVPYGDQEIMNPRNYMHMKKNIVKRAGIKVDDSAPDPTLAIFNLSSDVTEEILDDYIAEKTKELGVGYTVRVIISKKTRKCKGFAFIAFDNIEDSTAAKKILDGGEILGRSYIIAFAINRNTQERESETEPNMEKKYISDEDRSNQGKTAEENKEEKE